MARRPIYMNALKWQVIFRHFISVKSLSITNSRHGWQDQRLAVFLENFIQFHCSLVQVLILGRQFSFCTEIPVIQLEDQELSQSSNLNICNLIIFKK